MAKTNKIEYETKDFIVTKSKLPEAGLGLFTKRKFQKGESLGPYQGKLLTLPECEKIPELWGHMIDIEHIEGIAPYVALHPSKKMVLRYINHAPASIDGKKIRGKDAVNVAFNEISEPPYIEIVAIKDIDKGDEIYLNYGPGFSQIFLQNKKLREYYLKRHT